jgi:1,4-dihydroxy-2-naphthoate octaprenyltransferase
VFFIEVAKNASGELFDFQSGADQGVAEEDRSPFSGGKRVLVDGVLSARQTAWIAAAGYLAGGATGVAIAVLREPRVLWIGALGIACAWFYQAPPFKLSYRGLGEIAVAACYGPLIASGTYLVQRGEVTAEVALLSVPLGMAIASFLFVNEFPDYRADRAAGKRTLVVRLGRERGAVALAVLVAATYAALLAAPFFGLPALVLLGVAGALPATAAVRRVRDDPERTGRIIDAQAWMLAAFLLLAAGSGAGLRLAGAP